MKTINLVKALSISVLTIVSLVLPVYVFAATTEEMTMVEIYELYPDAKIDTKIWVSPEGSDKASGSEESPLQSISAAVKKATPGTAILVRSGVYKEQVSLNDLSRTSAKSPIVLVSTDGLQKAVIQAPDSASEAVQVYNSSYVGVFGFDLVGSSKGDQSYGSVVEVDGIRGYGSHSSADGNIVFSGNNIRNDGTGIDGFRAEYTHNLTFTGNNVSGNYRGQSIDLSTVWDSNISYNTVQGISKQALAVYNGSQDTVITNNSFVVQAQPAVRVGGDSIDSSTDFPSDFLGFAAKNIDFSKNVVKNTKGDGVWLAGATDSRVGGNYIDATGVNIHYRQVVRETAAGSDTINTENNNVKGNIYNGGTLSTSFAYDGVSQLVGSVISDNNIGDTDSPSISVGAGSNPGLKAVFVAGDGATASSFVGRIVETIDKLNVRAGAGLTQPVVKVTASGTRAEIVSVMPDIDGHTWYKVILEDGTNGWIASDYVKFVSVVKLESKSVSSFSLLKLVDISSIKIEVDFPGKSAIVYVEMVSGEAYHKKFTLKPGQDGENVIGFVADELKEDRIDVSVKTKIHVAVKDYVTKFDIAVIQGYEITYGVYSWSWTITIDYASGKKVVYASGTPLEKGLVEEYFGGDWYSYYKWFTDGVDKFTKNVEDDYYGTGDKVKAEDALLMLVAKTFDISLFSAKDIMTYSIGYGGGGGMASDGGGGI